MGARQYNPSSGRFTSIDPVEGGSANDYEYVAGDPIGLSDISGESPMKEAGFWESLWCASVAEAICDLAVRITEAAGQIASRWYPPGQSQNAFRHFVWQAALTMRLGGDAAEALGIAHERDGIDHGNSWYDTRVDYNNNQHGQNFGRWLLRRGVYLFDLRGWQWVIDSGRWFVATYALCPPTCPKSTYYVAKVLGYNGG